MNRLKKCIYLDYNASTPADKDVAQSVVHTMMHFYANPDSLHTAGEEARKIILDAKKIIAGNLNADADEICFTDSGTDANFMLLTGLFREYCGSGRHIIVSAAEHSSILDTAGFLQKEYGAEVSFAGVDQRGEIKYKEIEELIRKNTIIISVIHANNETGTINNLVRIGKTAAENGIIFHTDAVQSFCKTDIDVRQMNISALSFSGHKIYGPEGIAGFYLNRYLNLDCFITRNRDFLKYKSGTLNVHGIAGIRKAVEIMNENKENDRNHLKKLHKYFIDKILTSIPYAVYNGNIDNTIFNTVNFSFPGTVAAEVISDLNLNGIYASGGASCAGNSLSHVLKAMGLEHDLVVSAVRFSFGRYTTEEEIDETVEVLKKILRRRIR